MQKTKKVLTLRVTDEMASFYKNLAKADGFNSISAWITAAIAEKIKNTSSQTTTAARAADSPDSEEICL